MKKNLIVIKLGSNVLLAESGKLNTVVIREVVENIAEFHKKGDQFVIVTSGAVATGRDYFSGEKPETMDPALFSQLCSSLGQPILMRSYEEAFAPFHIRCSQNLFTQDNFKPGQTRDSAIQVLQSALDLGIVPIVNENDVISKTEIVFSDNDMLASHVALLLNAKKVVLLSNVSGFCTGNPDEGGVCLHKIERVEERHYSMVQDKKSSFGRGGMASKLDAAKLLTEAGIEMQLALGTEKSVVKRILEGENIGTTFLAQK